MVRLLLLLSLGLMGCKSDPYPEDVVVSATPQLQKEVESKVIIDYDKAGMIFTEGVEGRHYLKVLFEGEAYSDFEIRNKPEGMIYDEEEQELVWTPSFDEVSPTALNKKKDLKIRILANDPENANEIIDREIYLFVFNNNQKIALEDIEPKYIATEGKYSNFKFKINSLDYPNGPFKIVFSNLMEGASYSVKNNEVTITYTPGYGVFNFKKMSTSCKEDCYKDFTPAVEVFTPDGQSLVQTLNFSVKDVRVKPTYKVSKTYKTAGDSLSFDITVLDRNGEVEPRVSATSDITASEGSFSFSQVFTHSTTGNNNIKSRVSRFSWVNIPEALIGEKKYFDLKICTLKTNWYGFDDCYVEKIEVTVTGKKVTTPTIDRSKWPLATIKRLKTDGFLSVRIPVKIGWTNVTDVEIFPKEFEKFVSYKNSFLRIENAPEGIHQFNISAKGEWGGLAQESFIMEVLPKTWSSYLVMGVMPSNKVTSSMARLLPDFNFTNPFIVPLDSRMLSFRDWIIMTSNSFTGTEDEKAYAGGFDPVKNVFLSAADLSKVPESFKKEMKDLKIGIDAKFSKLVVDKEISEMSIIVADSSLADINENQDFGLAGTTGPNAKDPTILAVGSSSNCKPLLALNDGNSVKEFPISYVCERKNKGKLIVSGFDWGDLQGTGTNKKLSKRWLKKLLEK